MELNGWKRTRHVVEHLIEAPEGTVPDLQDSRSAHRMVIRPRRLTIHQKPDTNLVTYVTVEGRQVRRDGVLAGTKIILAGRTTDRDAVSPWWLNEILAELGLVWMTEQEALAR
jgi:hypothetical protein